MSCLLPRGIIKSTSPTALSISAVASRETGNNVTAFSSIPCSASTRRINATAHTLVSLASLPPLSRQALPAFTQSENTSKVTLGRASYITPITPNGTVTLFITIPLGRVTLDKVTFNGDGNEATERISDAMSRNRPSVNFNRSYLGSLSLIRAKSRAFASRIS